MKKFELGARDKRPASHGFGFHFHHANPHRRVPCRPGSLLAPLSADDIPPITPEAMASVQAALDLLANLVGDRDHNLFLGDCDRNGEMTAEARAIARVAEGLAGILRIEEVTPC